MAEERRVADYSGHLAEIGDMAYSIHPTENIMFIYGGALMGTVATYFTRQSLGIDFSFLSNDELFYRGLGTGIVLINRIADNISTRRAVLEFDEKFFEYELDRYYRERNPTLPDHPTISYMNKSIPKQLLLSALSFFIPELGYGLGIITVPLYSRNSKRFKSLKAAKKVGGMVKAGLDGGM